MRSLRSLANRSEASQLVEFAVAMPLLVVFVVGIFDFGQAFNIKLKLNGAVREGAQLAASQPTSDLTSTGAGGGAPGSIDAVRSVISNYLLAANLNDCGLGTQAGTSVGTLSWKYTASGNGCPGQLTLIINRAFAFKTTFNGVQTDEICTQVTISYPYQWHFNNVIQLLVPGASYAGNTLIPTDATAQNLN